MIDAPRLVEVGCREEMKDTRQSALRPDWRRYELQSLQVVIAPLFVSREGWPLRKP
jgi:hypothetical protein